MSITIPECVYKAAEKLPNGSLRTAIDVAIAAYVDLYPAPDRAEAERLVDALKNRDAHIATLTMKHWDAKAAIERAERAEAAHAAAEHRAKQLADALQKADADLADVKEESKAWNDQAHAEHKRHDDAGKEAKRLQAECIELERRILRYERKVAFCTGILSPSEPTNDPLGCDREVQPQTQVSPPTMSIAVLDHMRDHWETQMRALPEGSDAALACLQIANGYRVASLIQKGACAIAVAKARTAELLKRSGIVSPTQQDIEGG